jgi:peptidoglycan/xylan/chitin deacetylase (PgdA/CDA1 family)
MESRAYRFDGRHHRNRHTACPSNGQIFGMKHFRDRVIRSGLDALHVTGIHHLLRPLLAGVGGIFMLHHVRPRRDAAFQPNHHLEITPDFLRATLKHIRDLGIDIVTLDEMQRRLAARDFSRRFACFTLDDGYRDNRDHAAPVMREFDAPFAVYVASDFANGIGRLWWVALERVLAGAESVDVIIDKVTTRLDTATLQGKREAFVFLHEWLRRLPDSAAIHREVGALCERHGVDEQAISRELCLSWDELKKFAEEPLLTVGAHTVTHDNLAKQSEASVLHELTANRADIEAALQRPVRHLAYPYGDKLAAGPREFALAQRVGFQTAVTTRPGMVFAGNAAHPTALPRISLNGNYQDPRFLPVLTSGTATALWNRFRRVDVA